MAERTVREPRASGVRPAGHICHVCGEPIAVDEMLIAVQNITWSVLLPELPQLVRKLKLHPDPCAQVFIRKQQEDALHD